MPRATCVATVALSLLALAAPASAAPDDGSVRIDHMRPVADATFPAVAERCGRLAVSDPPDTWVKTNLLGLDTPGCGVAVRRGLSRRETCLVMAHEWGHEAGLSHSPDRRSIMYDDPSMVVGFAPCERFERLEVRLGGLRLDLDSARYDRAHAASGRERRACARRVKRILRRVRVAKRLLGP